jgi:glutamate-ammonia-ligase adenylyltransferase
MTTPDRSAEPLHLQLKPIPKSTREGARRLADLLDEDEAAPLRALVVQGSATAAVLAGIAEGSPFLWRLCRRYPADLAVLLGTPPAAMHAAILADMASAGTLSEADAMRILRRARGRAALLIALADLGGVFDTVVVTEALSDIADAAVQAGLRFALNEAAADKAFTPLDVARPEQGIGLFVLALGKHGARELNYSSDIDLAIFYEASAPGLATARHPHDLAVRLVKRIVKLLNERNADGYVERVDLRLRPDPGTTPIAMPVDAALHYYETVGQNWERAAMIKARVVAGDHAEGERFLKDLQPFIWRKYFDYSAIADIHAMKRQIYAVKGHDEITIPGHDVKLGRGGIREIEFFVQTQQLVYGGRRPNLRGRRTLDTLAELCREGWITPDARDELDAAYRALRDVEHRIQMVNDEQTQRLPKSEDDIASLARLGGENRSAFEKRLIREMKRVEAHYAKLFEAVPGLASNVGSLVFTGVEDDPETLKTLKKLGFRRPEMVTETIRGWHFGRRPAVSTPRAREVVTELVPGLLEAFGGAGDPDGALIAFDHALQRMPAAIELFSILKNSGDLRRLFAECLGSAPRLSEIVARSPHVLDTLVDPEFARRGEGQVRARIAPRLDREADFELFLDLARNLARAERFLLGTRVLSGVVPLADAGLAHTEIAEAFLDLVFARVRREFEARHGVVPEGGLAVVGYGKAGSREMTATSDLDLVVIYDGPPDAMSDGEKPLMSAEYFARLTQRLIAALSAPMRNGTLFEIDLRLRPSGKKGPVAASLGAFTAYQAEEAETWEHMALSRARVLIADGDMGTRVSAAIRHAVARPRDGARVRRDVAEMRAMMRKEKPGASIFDVKDWPGGLVDCEFIAQMLIIAHAHAHPSLMAGTANAILTEAARLELLGHDDADMLVAAYALQSGFSQAVRLFLTGDFDPAHAGAAMKKRLAMLLSLPDFSHLEAEIVARQKAARTLFQKVVG